MRKKGRGSRFVLRYDPDRIAAILAGEAERLHHVLTVAAHKGAAAAKAKRKARQRAFWKRKTGCRTGRLMALPGWQVLVARMEAGRWYSRPDLRQLIPEFADGSVRAWVHQYLWPMGLIERAENAAFDRTRAPGRQSESQWLYRLAPEGEAQAKAWREALGPEC